VTAAASEFLALWILFLTQDLGTAAASSSASRAVFFLEGAGLAFFSFLTSSVFHFRLGRGFRGRFFDSFLRRLRVIIYTVAYAFIGKASRKIISTMAVISPLSLERNFNDLILLTI
jgi:hypothetical protein